MWWVNQELEPHACEDSIKSDKSIIRAIILLVTNKHTQGYKEHVNYFIAFDIRECVTIIDCLEIMKLYVYDID